MTGTHRYYVFGAVRTHTGATTEWSFTGKQNDANGLVYLRARHCHPAVGRFLTRDPYPGTAIHPPGHNRYVYTESSPLDFTDPSGSWRIAQPIL